MENSHDGSLRDSPKDSPNEWVNTVLTGETQTSLKLLESAATPRPTTSLYGTRCKIQPGADELPVLKVGEPTTGCQLKSFAPDSPSAISLRDAEMTSAHIYQKAGEWVSRFPTGSGFVVASRGTKCLVVTDNHVVAGSEDELEVKIGNDRLRAAKVAVADPSNDLAIMSIETGADTAAICKPVKIAPPGFSSPEDEVAVVGYPAHSESLYISQGANLGIIRRKDYRDGDGDELPVLPGENPDRPILLMRMHVEGGNSGSAVYNGKSEVGAVLDGGDSNKLNSAFATPITQEQIDSLLSKIQ
ncbi:MAG: serine protease [Candidatus Obscuribacterales bacterium]